MKPEYEEIWKNLHVVKHEPNPADDWLNQDGGEIMYQYKDLPCYVDIYYFHKDDYFRGNTTYILNDINQDPLDTEEYYDLSKEEIAQVIIDLYTGGHNVPVGTERFGVSKAELDAIADELAADLGLDLDDKPIAQA
jgi:hypothetical protein